MGPQEGEGSWSQSSPVPVSGPSPNTTLTCHIPSPPLVLSEPHSYSHSRPEPCPLHLLVLQVRGEFVAVRQGLGALYLLLLLLPQGDTGRLEASPLSPGKAHPGRRAPHVAAGRGQLTQPVGGLAPRTINRCAQVTAWGITLHTVGMR